ncbi:MAG: MFS transporter [Myxococcota bacterium]|nr:MFS transporter [Myxococcota bacterium]
MIQRRLAPLFLTSFVLTAGYGSIYTLLAVIREQFGFSATSIGVIGAAGFLAGFSAQVALSRYADRGHTRSMLVLGLGFAILGNLGMVAAADLTAFIASRVLLGLGAGAFSPAVRRLVISADPARAGERLGFMASFEMAGFISGPVLASALYEAFGLRATFVVLASLLALLVVPVLRTPIPSAVRTRSDESPLRILFGLRAVRGTLFCSLAFYTTIGVFEAIWALLLADRGASQLFIGATLSVFSIPMLVFPPFAGRLAHRRGPLRIAAFGIAFAIPCMLAYGWLESLIGLAVVVAIHSIADSFTMPSLQLAVAQGSPPEHLASGQGLIGAAGQLTAAATALGSGWLYGGFGAEVLFGGAAALMAILLAVGLWQGAELLVPAADPPRAPSPS